MFELFRQREEPLTKDIARERLRHVLVRDRNQVTPQMMEIIRADITRVLGGYLEVDGVSLRLQTDPERGRDCSSLECSIPIGKVKKINPAPRRA